MGLFLSPAAYAIALSIQLGFLLLVEFMAPAPVEGMGAITGAIFFVWIYSKASAILTLESSLEVCRIASGNFTIEPDSNMVNSTLHNLTKSVGTYLNNAIPIESVQGICTWGVRAGLGAPNMVDGPFFPNLLRRQLKIWYEAGSWFFGSLLLEVALFTIFWIAVAVSLYFTVWLAIFLFQLKGAEALGPKAEASRRTAPYWTAVGIGIYSTCGYLYTTGLPALVRTIAVAELAWIAVVQQCLDGIRFVVGFTPLASYVAVNNAGKLLKKES